MKPLDVLLILVCLMFATGVIVDRRWGPERRRHEEQVRFQQERLELIHKELDEYRARSGRYPTTEEGLEAVPGLRGALMSGRFLSARSFLERSEGIRTIHGIPFVYHNTEDGKRAGAYANSPARLDQHFNRRFSRKIDPGVHVASLGLQQDVSRVFGRQWLDALLWFGGGAILFLAIAYIVARNRRSADRVRGINAMVVVGVALLLGIIVVTSGGGELAKSMVGAQPAIECIQREDLLAEYLALMETFVAQGGLDPAAFAAQRDVLCREFGLDEPPVPAANAPESAVAPASGG